MKLAIALAAAAGIALAIPAANADETRVGVGVGPVGAGVTVGEHRDRDRTTVIKEREPAEHTTVIKKERVEPEHKTTIIVVTHNRGTIQTADALYGVTVGDDSVSRVISLRLEEATALAERAAEPVAVPAGG